MNGRALLEAAAFFAGAQVSTLLLVALAPRLGLVDDASDARERKHHQRPVPLVGGPVIALALLAWVLVRGVDVLGGTLPGGVAFAPYAILAAAGLAFATGLVDDVLPRGLGPLAKFAGQSAAGTALAVGLLVDGVHPSLACCALAALGAVVAQNAANTFDNADGALTAVASAGLAFASPLAGVTLGFLPWTFLGRQDDRTRRAWLGDSGSHLLGILLFTTPIACAALLVPLLDLARVVWVRFRAGDPIWVGDRRHLAHVLQARGLAPIPVALVLVALALPGIALLAFRSG
jgi:UDP-GlcNAc:undecaprenyl-phosphate GlcNAc-1-phosphate transferase